MKKILLLSLLFAIGTYAFGQTPLSLTGTTTATNFDGGTLDNNINGSSLNTFPVGWGLVEQGSSTNSNINGFYRAGSGGSPVADARSYGTFSTQERAFGAIANGTLQATLGFTFTNNTGSNITSMAVSYTGEQWRSSGSSNPLVDSLVFEYSLNATSTGDPSATWVAVSALHFTSPNANGLQGTTDGNLAVNQTNLSATITAAVGNGSTVHFRWRDINIAQTNDGLAVDNFAMTVTTSSGPLPPVLVSTNPADNAINVPLATTALTLTLDQTITSLGTGNVTLFNITNSTSTNIPAANISFAGAVLTISGVTLAANTDYAVQITPNMINATNGPYAGIINNTTWNFKTFNPAPPPVLVSTNPADNATNVPVTTTALTLTLDQNITSLGTGNVTLFNITNATSTTIPAANISFAGAVLTISGVTLASNTDYAVQITPNMINATNGAYAGITNNTTWNFKTVNTTPPPPPVLLSTNPADNATNVPLTTTALTLTLDQNITSLGTGNVTLFNITNATSITIPAANITFSGAVLTISGVTLASNTDYAVQITPNMISATNGAYAGITNNTIWNFKTTTSTTPLPPVLVSTNPVDNTTNVPFTATTISITLDQAITSVGAGNVTLINLTNSSSISLTNFTTSGATATFAGIALSPNTDYAVQIDAGVLNSANGAFAGISNNTSWNFKTEIATAVSDFDKTNLSVQILGDVTSQLNLQMWSSQERNLNYTILDMAGKTIDKGNLSIAKGKQQHSLNVTTLNPGLYLLQLHNTKAQSVLKFIVK